MSQERKMILKVMQFLKMENKHKINIQKFKHIAKEMKKKKNLKLT